MVVKTFINIESKMTWQLCCSDAFISILGLGEDKNRVAYILLLPRFTPDQSRDIFAGRCPYCREEAPDHTYVTCHRGLQTRGSEMTSHLGV